MRKIFFTLPLLALVLSMAVMGCQSGSSEAEAPDKITAMPISTESDAAMEAMKNGLAAWDLGNDQAAHAFFTAALEADPNLAIAHVMAGETANTAEAYKKGMADAKSHMDGASDYEKQMIAWFGTYATGDANQRLAIANELITAYPDVSRSFVLLGEVYWQMNDVAQSREALERAVALDPSDANAHYMLASSLIFGDPKDYDKAAANATKLVGLAPSSPQGHILLGDVHRAQNDLEGAKDAYAEAIALDPTNSECYYKKGHANTFLGNMEEARADFASAAQHDRNADYSFEACTYLYSGEPDKAASLLKEKFDGVETMGLDAARARELRIDLLNDRMWIAMHQGDAKKVASLNAQINPLAEQRAEVMGTMESMKQNEAWAMFRGSIASSLAGDTDAALAMLDNMKASLEPIQNPRKMEGYHFAKGFAHYHKGDYEGAIAEFGMANPEWNYAQYWLAKSHEMAGNEDGAMEIYAELADDRFNSIWNGLIHRDVTGKVAS